MTIGNMRELAARPLRSKGWIGAVFCILLYVSQALSQEWQGHLARLHDAKIACADIFSHACQPYLAQAVGIVDYIQWAHSQPYCDKLNGQDVTRLALILDEKAFFYWTQAVIAATRHICELP